MSNRIYDALDSVSAEYELKDHTRKYLARKINRRRFGAVRFAAAVICLLSVLAGGGGYAFYRTPVAAISIDINPSMEWEVNRLDRVVSVVCYNEEAEKTAAELRLKHRKYEDALTVLLTSREMSDYLSKDAAVNISVASQDAYKSMEIQERAAQCAGHHCGNVSCHGGSMEEWQAANEAGVSLGKYQAFLILQESDPSVTLEEISGMCMSQIQSLIAESNAGGAETGCPDSHGSCGSHGCHRNENGCMSHHGQSSY